jgi:antitoxin (DNA-binding transcriptional repressor) of toxin-antitoxin stability system
VPAYFSSSGCPYPGDVTSAHAYELPPHTSAPAEAVEAAERGQVVYLTRNGQNTAAIVPPDVATAGAAAIEALEDAEDLRAAQAEPGPDIPLEDLLARYADDLAAYPEDTDER